MIKILFFIETLSGGGAEKVLQNLVNNMDYEKFDITFGNRIANQLEKFVPVYIACGGTVDEAIDIMFSRKVLRKLENK